MKRIEEEYLAFDFGERWKVFKFDEHRDYQRMKDTLEGTKAIDFLGILDNKDLYMIEVKDFRQHRIETRDRLLTGELATELAQKVRDSLACITGAYRTSSDPEHWRDYAEFICNNRRIIKVVLWLEHDLPPHPYQRRKVMASIGVKVFKQKLKWLTSHVLVCGSNWQDLPGAEVSNITK